MACQFKHHHPTSTAESNRRIAPSCQPTGDAPSPKARSCRVGQEGQAHPAPWGWSRGKGLSRKMCVSCANMRKKEWPTGRFPRKKNPCSRAGSNCLPWDVSVPRRCRSPGRGIMKYETHALPTELLKRIAYVAMFTIFYLADPEGESPPMSPCFTLVADQRHTQARRVTDTNAVISHWLRRATASHGGRRRATAGPGDARRATQTRLTRAARCARAGQKYAARGSWSVRQHGQAQYTPPLKRCVYP